ncbi:MAG: AAA family ATPase [Acutalibacteraceae bacterium]|nr:AAA family ATPase [Acutalibacteraceae bacterium]
MPKPRIIIADTDVNYIFPIQLKFVEEFFDKIDIEIICDESYYEEFFSTPQKIDILIVCENLYDSRIQRHNISHIFVMNEQYEEDQTSDLNLNKIYKYTSIKEIFNEILGKSSNELKVDVECKQESQIIVVTAASGGVGKTTVAMGICASLTKNYKKVLYINSDQLQTFQHLMNNNTPITNLEIYSNLLKISRDQVYNEIKHVVRNENFNYIPPFKVAIMAVGLVKNIYMDIAVSAKRTGEYDYIVVDTDSVFDEFKLDLFNVADKVIFVTKQNKMSVMATNTLMLNLNGVDEEKYLCVCNDFDKNIDNALISPECILKYAVNEYIEHMPHYDKLNCTDFINYSGFQKLAYLFM